MAGFVPLQLAVDKGISMISTRDTQPFLGNTTGPLYASLFTAARLKGMGPIDADTLVKQFLSQVG